MIRPVRAEDAEELAALYRANRKFLAPFEPPRADAFFTAQGQLERLEKQLADGAQPFAILDGEAVAGTINVSNFVHGAFRSANLGYFVDRA